MKEIIASNVVQLAEVLIKKGIGGSNFVPRKVESASNASYTENIMKYQKKFLNMEFLWYQIIMEL